jgi:hypothetical protein
MYLMPVLLCMPGRPIRSGIRVLGWCAPMRTVLWHRRVAFTLHAKCGDFRHAGHSVLIVSNPVATNMADGYSRLYNLDESIRSFAVACFNYGLLRNGPVYLLTKNTIFNAYNGGGR